MAPLIKAAKLEDKKENEFFLAITDTLRIKGLWLSNYLWCRVLHIAYTLCNKQEEICKTSNRFAKTMQQEFAKSTSHVFLSLPEVLQTAIEKFPAAETSSS